MFEAKLLFLLCLGIAVAEAQFRRLPPTKKPPPESLISVNDSLSHSHNRSDPISNKTSPDVIIVYPETHSNKSFFKLPHHDLQQEPTVDPNAKPESMSGEKFKSEAELESHNESNVEIPVKDSQHFNKDLSVISDSNGNTEETDSANKPALESAIENETQPKPQPEPSETTESVVESQPEISLEPSTSEPNDSLNLSTEEKSDVSTFRPRPPYPNSTTRRPNKPIYLTTTHKIYPTPSIASSTLQYPTTLRPDMKDLCKVENSYYSISYECDTYVECKNYVAEKYICPNGLLFNSKAHWPEYPCALPSEVECGNKTIIQEPESVGECPRRFGTFPSPSGDCGKYIVCDDGRTLHMKCPNGLVFNPKFNACDWPESVPDCKPKVFKNFTCPIPPKDIHGRFSEKTYNYKYRNSCKEYIACNKGEPRLLRCDSGLHFDEISARCVDSKAVRNCIH